MHDIKFIREHPEAFDAGLARRFLPQKAEELLDLDVLLRIEKTRQQQGLARRNELSKQFGELKRQGLGTPTDLVAELDSLKTNLPQGDVEIARLEKLIGDALAALPNLPDTQVPDGTDEKQNKEISHWGKPRQFNFVPLEHADLGPVLGLDFETGVLISGARFTFLRGSMARLERALGQFMLNVHISHVTSDGRPKNSFTECAPPLMVRDEAVFGTGQLPKFAEDLFHTNIPVGDEYLREQIDQIFSDLGPETEWADDATLLMIKERTVAAVKEASSKGSRHSRRWLIPTAEVSLTNSVREQILAETDLPIRMTALTPCFRSEAGAAGKDTRGYIRQHQFEKVELVSICKPEDSEAEHERMTGAAESILQALDLPYRKMLLCAGDMGFTARKTYDLEVWLPGQNAYREISSISNCGDFQARRMNTRYRPDGAKGTEFVHTLNGSGLAVGRTLVAVLENYQQADGSVTVPDALLPYMGGITALVPA